MSWNAGWRAVSGAGAGVGTVGVLAFARAKVAANPSLLSGDGFCLTAFCASSIASAWRPRPSSAHDRWFQPLVSHILSLPATSISRRAITSQRANWPTSSRTPAYALSCEASNAAGSSCHARS